MHTNTTRAAALALVFFTSSVFAEDVQEVTLVHQLSDLMAATAQHIYKFDPSTLHIEVGATVAFINSVGSHTVKTQVGIWPEDVEPLDIQGERRVEVTFDTPGIYGITCGRHGVYGMSMLIAVGKQGLTDAAQLNTSTLKASSMAKNSFANQVSALLESNN